MWCGVAWLAWCGAVWLAWCGVAWHDRVSRVKSWLKSWDCIQHKVLKITDTSCLQKRDTGSERQRQGEEGCVKAQEKTLEYN